MSQGLLHSGHNVGCVYFVHGIQVMGRFVNVLYGVVRNIVVDSREEQRFDVTPIPLCDVLFHVMIDTCIHAWYVGEGGVRLRSGEPEHAIECTYDRPRRDVALCAFLAFLLSTPYAFYH